MIWVACGKENEYRERCEKKLIPIKTNVKPIGGNTSDVLM